MRTSQAIVSGTRFAVVVALALTFLPGAAFAGPKITMVEDAIEAEGLEIFRRADGNGFATIRVCRDCESVELPVDGATRAYESGQEVPLAAVPRPGTRPVTVFFLIESNVVSRIVW